MHSTFFDNIRISKALLHKELKALRTGFFDEIIDGIINLVIQVMVMGYMYPLLGMPGSLIGPIYLGTFAMRVFHLGFTGALKTVFDLKHNRFIDYQLTLPLPKRWLFGTYVLARSIELVVINGPLIIFGLVLLRSLVDLSQANWLLFGAFFVVNVSYFALFFLAIGYAYEFHWFMNNVWPRRLAPMFCLSAIFFVWADVYAFSPVFGFLFLLNPLTYATEGLRAAMLGSTGFIPVWICTLALVVFAGFTTIFLKRCIYERIDPV